MAPQLKKVLSSVAVAAGGAALAALSTYVVQLPEIWQGLAGSALAAAVHYINAWGTHEQVIEKTLGDR
jgi:hypothetical protein